MLVSPRVFEGRLRLDASSLAFREHCRKVSIGHRPTSTLGQPLSDEFPHPTKTKATRKQEANHGLHHQQHTLKRLMLTKRPSRRSDVVSNSSRVLEFSES